jgi:purine-nucleoside/S-methyl-5'-thioadenosine phosphorylase / adenosine deaminase
VLAELHERIDLDARPKVEIHLFEAAPVLEVRLPGPFRACFTTRLGGESTGAFASLNLDPRSEDDPVVVARNRDRIARMVGRHLVSPLQVHGLRVAGAAEYAREQPDSPCDGLTLHPELDRGLAALLLFADCVPLVMCGEVDMAVAHGGWRGILGGIVQQAGRAMIGPPATAVIGPSIGPCCFTVGEEVARSFAARFGPEVVLGPRTAGEPPRVDLWAAAAKALAELGVRPEQVVNPRICTSCNRDLFYSYRTEGPVTGRHGCLAWMVDA